MPMDPHKAGSVAACMRRYAQYLQDKRRSRGLGSASMPPWDENAHFDIPTETIFSVTTTPLSVAKANPNRVAIMFSDAGPGDVTLSTLSNVAAGQGIHLGLTVLPWIVLQSQVGPLCAVEWFAVTTMGGAVLDVVEINLREWPGSR